VGFDNFSGFPIKSGMTGCVFGRADRAHSEEFALVESISRSLRESTRSVRGRFGWATVQKLSHISRRYNRLWFEIATRPAGARDDSVFLRGGARDDSVFLRGALRDDSGFLRGERFRMGHPPDFITIFYRDRGIVK